MATRFITFTQKNKEDDILFICNNEADWSPLSIENAISHIEDGTHSYFAAGPNGVEAKVHVVNGASGKYLRSNQDKSSSNNLDNLDALLFEGLPVFINDYPSNRKSDWSDNLQGVTHSNDHWFFTQLTKLYKFHVSTALNSNKSAAVTIASMPKALEDVSCDHFGDPDYIHVNGAGYIFIPVEGSDGACKREPRLAVFRDDDQLSFIGMSLLSGQNSDKNTGRAGWCAFSPIDNLLYSSTNKISAEFPVFRYQINFDALAQGDVIIERQSDFNLLADNGDSINIKKYVQGGCFSPEGILYIVNGKMLDNETEGGIRAFSPSGEFLYKSSTSRKPFKYKYRSGPIFRQEPEGITYWDLGSLPVGVTAPNITGQLHAILLNNDLGDDAIYFKHYMKPTRVSE